MTVADLWIAKVEKDREVVSHRYDGSQEAGDEGVITSTYDDIYWAVRRTKEEAEERVRGMWDRRIRDEEKEKP